MQRLKFAVGLVSFWIVSMLGGLVLAATVLPLVTSWDRVVLTSGSMQPLIDPGDIVLTRQASHPLAPGTVVVFKNPNKPGALITHRVIENLPDGSYRTKGDANAQPDVSPVAQENVIGRGAMLVPVIGRPAIWARQGYPTLAGAAAVVVFLLVWLSRYGLLAKYDPWLNQERTNRPGNPKPRKKSGRRAAAGKASVLTVVAARFRMAPEKSLWAGGPKNAAFTLGALVISLLIITAAAPITAPQPSAAAFTAHTFNSGNAFKVPCTNRTVIATADTYVDQTHPGTVAKSAELRVLSHAKDQRTLLRFPLSAVPSGCTIVAAQLYLYSTSSVAGRTIVAEQVTGSWSEASTTWNNQPETAGPASTSPSGVGERVWTVTEQTRAMASSGEVNLRLRDSVEQSGTGQLQVYSTREGANPPRLVLTLN